MVQPWKLNLTESKHKNFTYPKTKVVYIIIFNKHTTINCSNSFCNSLIRYSHSCLWISNPLASVSWAAGLQVWTTTPNSGAHTVVSWDKWTFFDRVRSQSCLSFLYRHILALNRHNNELCLLWQFQYRIAQNRNSSKNTHNPTVHTQSTQSVSNLPELS